MFLLLSDRRLVSFLPYPKPLPCLHYRQNHPSLIPSSFLPLRSYQDHNCWIGGSLDESPPSNKLTKNSTNTSWLARARQPSRCTLRRASFLKGRSHCVTQISFQFPLNDFYGAGTTVFLQHFRVLIANAFRFKFHLTISRLLVLYVFTASWRLDLKIGK